MNKFAFSLLALVAGCGHLAEPLRRDPVDAQFVFPRDGARSAKVHLTSQGNVSVRGGSCSLVQARAQYDEAHAEARTEYSIDENAQASVTVELSSEDARSSDMELDVCLSTELPMSVDATAPVGDVTMDLSGVQVRGLDVEVDVGRLRVDFADASVAKASIDVEAGVGSVELDAKRSTWTGGNELQIEVGTGDVTVYLPRGVGLRVEASSGVGAVDVRGLERTGDAYANTLASSSADVLRVDIEVGVGDVTVIAG